MMPNKVLSVQSLFLYFYTHQDNLISRQELYVYFNIKSRKKLSGILNILKKYNCIESVRHNIYKFNKENRNRHYIRFTTESNKYKMKNLLIFK